MFQMFFDQFQVLLHSLKLLINSVGVLQRDIREVALRLSINGHPQPLHQENDPQQHRCENKNLPKNFPFLIPVQSLFKLAENPFSSHNPSLSFFIVWDAELTNKTKSVHITIKVS